MARKIRIALKLLVYRLLSKKTRLIKDERYNKLLFWITFGRRANFDKPTTFNEYVCARKVRRDEEYLSVYTDKYAVREYVRKTIGDAYLNEAYGVYTSYDDIDFDALPERFAMKCTHGSGMNVIVTDKSKLDHAATRKKMKKWLGENFYYKAREKNYKPIQPRIMCDAYLSAKDGGGLPEMKVFCFGGKAKFISFNLFQGDKPYTNYYDADWNRLELRVGYENFPQDALPDNRDEVLRVAETLAAPFDFVRVDLYNIDGRILFSELTFHSGGGFTPFTPASYDREFAKYFEELEEPV
jgi:hypothetical protein